MKRIRTVLVLVIASLAFGGVASPANAAVGDLVIKNQTGASFVVCQNWGTTSCRSDSPRCRLYAGENSKTKCGWQDADGIYVPTNDILFVYPERQYVLTSYGAGAWYKRSGCSGCTSAYEVYPA